MIAELSSADISMAELSRSKNKGVCASSSESAFILGILENKGNTSATCSWNCLFTATERGEDKHNALSIQIAYEVVVLIWQLAQCHFDFGMC